MDVTETTIDQLTTDQHNANAGTERGRYLLDHSLRQYGAGRSILVDKEGRVIAGNKTLEAAADIGLEDVVIVQTDGTKLVAVQRTDLDLDNGDDRARLMAYADNRASETGLQWDPAAIQFDLEAGLDLSGMFQEFELGEILADIAPEPVPDPGAQVDKAAELQEKWGVQRGQIYQVGRHKIMCGDSTDAGDVARLMGEARAALLVTSPPYGIGKDYESGGVDEWRSLMISVFSAYAGTTPLWFVNLANRRTGNDGWEAHTFGMLVNEFEKLGYRMIGLRVWAKPPTWLQHPYWRNTYKPVDDFEFMGLFAAEKPKHYSRLTTDENTDWGYRGVWSFGSVGKNDVHSAMYPVELPARAIRLLTDQKAVIVDPFLGSGTTLVACEQTNRIGYGMEIEPKYVAVTLERLAGMGLEPRLVTPVTNHGT